MARPNVTIKDADGNIGVEKTTNEDNICGLLYDTSSQADIWTNGAGSQLAAKLKDTVIELNSLDDLAETGIPEFKGSDDFMAGVPYYHIKHFFKKNNGTGVLYVAFADCSANFNALLKMQQIANGTISQFGIWTEQLLWEDAGDSAETYRLKLVDDINAVAQTMANDYHAPAVFILNANTSKVKSSSGSSSTVVVSKLPSCDSDNRYVAVSISQDSDITVRKMQGSLTSTTPVGNIGALLGELANASVCDCIGWVAKYDFSSYFVGIEFGFGDATVVEGTIKNSTPYEALTNAQLDHIDDLGYMFMLRHVGLSGIYFNNDATCSTGDYRTIGRNRTINKSRRNVRKALLPYVNSPIKVDPATGQLSSATITIFTNLITDVLNAMVAAEEVSGIGSVVVPANQNILKNDQLIISYSLIPLGTAKEIKVTQGFVLSQQQSNAQL